MNMLVLRSGKETTHLFLSKIPGARRKVIVFRSLSIACTKMRWLSKLSEIVSSFSIY